MGTAITREFGSGLEASSIPREHIALDAELAPAAEQAPHGSGEAREQVAAVEDVVLAEYYRRFAGAVSGDGVVSGLASHASWEP